MSAVLQPRLDLELVPLYSSRARKRWRTVFATLNITRAFQSLVAKKQNGLSRRKLRSPSYTALDVKPDLFLIDQSSLSGLTEKQNFDELSQFGGVEGVLAAVKTHGENGIQGNDEDIAIRNKEFGSNIYQKPPARREIHLVLEALKDPIFLILLLCAALSLGFGINKHGGKGWSDGGSIFVAVFLVVAVTVMSNLWPKMQFNKLSKACNDIPVAVVRNGQQKHIPMSNVVVGDVVLLKIGDRVPADGLLIDGHGHSLRVDESSLTGESEPVKVDCCPKPFLLSGTMVADGQARMLVTSVGINTAWGKNMSRIRYDYNKKTPLQAKVNKVTLFIAKVGLVVAFLVLVVLLIRYFTGHMNDNNGKRMFIGARRSIHDVLNAVLGILATPVAIASAAIPEGLLLAVTISLAYSAKQMVGDQALVRNLSKHEEVAFATVICTNKRGALASSDMKVTMFWIGQKCIEGGNSSIAPTVLELLHQGVALSTDQAPLDSQSQPFDNEAEKAIYNWGVQEMSMDMEGLRKSYNILHVKAFDPEKKWSQIVIKKPADSTIHVHQKGAPEAILAMCSHYYKDAANIEAINSRVREELEERIQIMATSGLHCIAFAHKQMSAEDYNNEKSHPEEQEEEGLTFLGLVGLKHPCHDGVRRAVEDFMKAGVAIKMITRDDVSAAIATAAECGIIKANEDITPGEVVDGKEFQNFTDEEKKERVEKIRVMARATPVNKRDMVQCLKEKGHVVAVTGDSTEDVPALREANIGISLGVQATDMAKENSDIVILDDNFASVVRAWRWGIGMYNNIQIFTQFQLTVSIASLVIDLVTAISAAEPPTINIVAAISAGKVPYATVQVLWVKMIVGTLAALALTIEKPDEEIMEQLPVKRTQPFIMAIMWRNILAQASYQIVVLLTIQFKGQSIFTVDAKVKDTLIFNTFVLCQIFMIFNARKFEKNIFKRLQKNKLFWVVIGGTIVLQAVMVELLKRFADTERLSWGQWGACVGIAALSCPFGWLIKCIPVHNNPYFTSLVGRFQL